MVPFSPHRYESAFAIGDIVEPLSCRAVCGPGPRRTIDGKQNDALVADGYEFSDFKAVRHCHEPLGGPGIARCPRPPLGDVR